MSDQHYKRFIDEDLDWLEEVDGQKKEWDESKHPRGQPGNAGQFGPGGGGESDDTSGGKEGGKEGTPYGKEKNGGGVKTPGDFARNGIGLYPEITSDMKTQNTFFDLWNTRIDKPPGKFKEEFFSKALKGTMRLDFQNREKSLQVLTTPKTDDGHAMGDIRATIFFDQRRVHMDYYELGREFQGKGIMKDVMRSEMKMWNEMGIKKIDMYANIDVGGHAWARYGFVPTPEAWYALSRDLGDKIDRMRSGGGEGYDDASGWEELSSQRQGRIEQSYDMQTRDEFLQSEIEHWRDNGQPLEEAKNDIVTQFETGAETAWVSDAVEGYRLDRLESGKPDIPFSDEDIVNAIKLDFSSPYGDGRGNASVTFNNNKLKNPKDVDPGQLHLPGITKPKPHDYLTADMREGITKAVQSGFNTTADRIVDDIEPPDFTEAVRDNQNDAWDQMSDRDRFRWAENNASDLLTGVTQKRTGEMSEEDADRLQKVLDTAGPKGIWVIADSKWGKDLLLNENWDGELKLGDKQSMARFEAYIGKAKN